MLRKLEKTMMGILNEENSNNKDVILERSTSSSSLKKKSSSKRSKSKTKKRSIKTTNDLSSPSKTTKIKKKSKGSSNNEEIDSTTGHESTYTATTVNMESSQSLNLSFHGEDSDLPFFSLESPISLVRKADMSSTSFQTASPSSHSSATSLALESLEHDNDNNNKATEDAAKDTIPTTQKSSPTKKKKKSLKKLTSSSSTSPSSKTMKRIASEGNLIEQQRSKCKSEKHADDKGGYNSDTAMSKKVQKKKKKIRSTPQQDSASEGTNTSSSKVSTRSASERNLVKEAKRSKSKLEEKTMDECGYNSDSAMSKKKKKKKIKKKKKEISPTDLESYLEGCNSSSDSQLLPQSPTELFSTTSKTDNVKKDDTVSKTAPKTGEVKKDNMVSSSLDQEQKKVSKCPKKSKKDKVKKGKDEIKEGKKEDNAIKKHTNSNKQPSLDTDHEAADVDQSNESKDAVQVLDADKVTELDNPKPKAKPSKSPITSKPKHRHSSSDIVSSSIGPLEQKIRDSSDSNLSIDGLLSPRTAHGVCAIIFGLIFLIATFGWSFWLIGPEQLIAGWDTEDDTLNFVTRFLVGVLLGLGYFEYVLADHEKSKDIFVRYHVVLAILMLWSTVAVQVYWLSWLYGALITLFLIGGIVGTTEGYSAVES